MIQWSQHSSSPSPLTVCSLTIHRWTPLRKFSVHPLPSAVSWSAGSAKPGLELLELMLLKGLWKYGPNNIWQMQKKRIILTHHLVSEGGRCFEKNAIVPVNSAQQYIKQFTACQTSFNNNHLSNLNPSFYSIHGYVKRWMESSETDPLRLTLPPKQYVPRKAQPLLIYLGQSCIFNMKPLIIFSPINCTKTK